MQSLESHLFREVRSLPKGPTVSISSLQSDIQRAHSDIASLTHKLSDFSSKLADKSGKLADAQQAAGRATSSSTQNSKLQEAARLLKDIAGLEKDKANVEGQIGDKKRTLHRHEESLSKEQERETRKALDASKQQQKERDDSDKRRRREMEDYQRQLDNDMASRRAAALNNSRAEFSPAAVHEQKTYDLFISHAWEDKEDFVRPLAAALEALGLVIWYDEATLTVGDSLRQSIDRGLVNSRYGVVVVSTAFFAKQWPQYELNGLVTREMAGSKVILPIWHKVSKDEVAAHSPTLADKLALNTSVKSVAEIAQELAQLFKV